MTSGRRKPRDEEPTVDRRRVLQTAGALAGAVALLTNTGAPARGGARTSTHTGGTTDMVYQVEGRLLEVCTCNTLCPCWVGEDPDGGICESSLAYHFDKGTIQGVDVAGRTVAVSVHIPGNVLAGNWRGLIYIDDGASEAQHDALAQLFTGKLGGPLADYASLFGEVIAIERAPITFTVEEGKGTLTVGSMVEAVLSPFAGATGGLTTLNDTIFSTIPGSPAYPGKAALYRRDDTGQGLAAVNVTGQNAIQGYFRFEA